MAKSKQKVSNKLVRSTLNDVSAPDYNNTFIPLATSTDNFVVNTVNAIVTDNIEDQVYLGRSTIRKYVLKIGSDKVRCDICQVLKYL